MAVATNALTTIGQCEAELSLTAAAQDALLTRYINTASDTIANYIGHDLYYATGIAESVPGPGSKDPFIFIGQSPLITITSIVDAAGTTVTASTYSIWNADAGQIYRANGWDRTNVNSTQLDRYVVTYVGGWITREQADVGALGTRTLPYDIETVCINMVSRMWRQKGADDSIKSESILNTSVSYGSARRSMTNDDMMVLDDYQRMDTLGIIR